MGAGRPRIEIDLAEVERLAGRGLSQEQIADALGISRHTIGRRKKDTAAFEEALKRGQAKGVLDVTNALYEQAMDGNVAAAIFYLKNRAGWRDRQEHTGADGGPIKTEETKMLRVVGVSPAKDNKP